MSGDRGFTLVEVLVAVLLLSLGGLALISTAGSIPRVAEIGRRETRVSASARSALESLRSHACAGATDDWDGAEFDVASWDIRALGDSIYAVTVVVRNETPTAVWIDSLSSSVVC